MEFAESEARSEPVHEVGAVFAEGAYPETRIDAAYAETGIPRHPARFGIDIEGSEVEPAQAHEVQAIGVDLQTRVSVQRPGRAAEVDVATLDAEVEERQVPVVTREKLVTCVVFAEVGHVRNVRRDLQCGLADRAAHIETAVGRLRRSE